MSERILSAGSVAQRSLADDLDRVYAVISGEKGDEGTGVSEEIFSPEIRRFAALFNLSDFERELLLLCAGAVLETRFQQACARVNANENAVWPTFSMAMNVLPGAHWSVLSRLRPLRYWKLLEVDASHGLLQAPLKIDERILQYLLGVPAVDATLEWIVRPLQDRPASFVASREVVARKIAAHWASANERAPELVVLSARDAASARAVFVEACREASFLPFMLRAGDILSSTTDREVLLRYWTREAILSGAALLMEGNSESGEEVAALTAFTRSLAVPAAVTAISGSALERLDGCHISVPAAGRESRKQIWLQTLGAPATVLNGHLDQIVDRFDFDEATIRMAALDAASEKLDGDDLAQVLLASCRGQARRLLEGLAQRIEPRAQWEDLVLPPQQMMMLRELILHVKHRRRVHQDWGFASRYGRGLGLSVLFAGPSGTGKTMAAEVLAGDLELDLYQIDLASIVSKYIGETEKNLKRIFDAAERSGAVLLFDEADALFGKRSEVKDSHDRYANLEVSYLLQRMEAYSGMAILTTNLQRAIDPAFLRRIRFIVQFPFPDEGLRRDIWKRVFPVETPTEDLLPDRLSQLHVSGAVIRNIATHAAFLAASENQPVRMSHIAAGARTEYTKMEKILTPTEMGGWA